MSWLSILKSSPPAMLHKAQVASRQGLQKAGCISGAVCRNPQLNSVVQLSRFQLHAGGAGSWALMLQTKDRYGNSLPSKAADSGPPGSLEAENNFLVCRNMP